MAERWVGRKIAVHHLIRSYKSDNDLSQIRSISGHAFVVLLIVCLCPDVHIYRE